MESRRAAANGQLPFDGALTLDQQKQILAVAANEGPGRRDMIVVLLGMRAGLSAREEHRLDVRDVSPDGAKVPQYIRIPGRQSQTHPALPPGAVPVPGTICAEIEAYLAWKRAICAHGTGRFGTAVGRDGVERCHVCRQPLDFGKAPFFEARQRRRLSERQIHKIFAKLRARCELDGRHTFDSLVRTHERHLADLLTKAVQTDG